MSVRGVQAVESKQTVSVSFQFYGSSQLRADLGDLGISEALDLTDAHDLARFRQAAQTALPEDLAQETLASIEALRSYLSSPRWLTWRPDIGSGFLVPAGDGDSYFLSILEAVGLGLQLGRLERCPGFDQFIGGFQNPPQFQDTLFEATAADLCHRKVGPVSFGPEYEVRGHRKRPEFETASPFGNIVHECKNGDELDRQYTDQLDRFSKVLRSELREGRGLGGGLRLEVELLGPFPSDSQKVAKDIVSTARGWGTANMGRPFSTSPARAVVSPLAVPPMLHASDFVEPQADLSVYRLGPGLEAARAKALGALMSDALTQLPEDKPGLIWIRTTAGDPARLAAQRRLVDPAYEHVLGICIQAQHGLQVVHRKPPDEPLPELLKLLSIKA